MNRVKVKVIYLSVGKPVEASLKVNHVKVKVIYLSVGQPVEASLQVNHVPVKVVQEPVLQYGVVHQIPLTSCVVVAFVVATAREVQPLRVAKFIACTRGKLVV